jgi:hypothetical protein
VELAAVGVGHDTLLLSIVPAGAELQMVKPISSKVLGTVCSPVQYLMQ